MALERRNPLPPGVYWVDVWEPAQERFNAWVSDFDVIILKTTGHAAEGGRPARDWVLFEIVDKPPPFAPTPQPPERVEGVPLSSVGFPTIAESRDIEEEDTEDAPDPEPPVDIDDLLSKARSNLGWFIVGGVAATAVVVFIAVKIK
jgi:hypothetical protein